MKTPLASLLSRAAGRRPAAASPLRAGLVAAHALVAATGIAAFVVMTGCYTYTTQPVATIPARSTIGVDITDAGRVHIGQAIGQEVAHLDGTFVAQSDSGMRMHVEQATFINGNTQNNIDTDVTLAPGDIKAVQRRTLAPSTTALAVAIGIAIVAAVLAIAVNGSSGNPKDSGNPGTGTGAN